MALCITVLVIGFVGYVICKMKSRADLQKSFLVCIASAVLALIAGYMEQEETVLSENKYLIRQEMGAGDYDVELVLNAEDMEERSFQITVPEQRLTEAEELMYLEEAISEIEGEFKGENTSLEEIREYVEIRESYQNNVVNAKWDFSNTGLIRENGLIDEAALTMEGEEVCATVTLTCGESRLLYSFYFTVFSREKTEEEKLDEKIYAFISEDAENAGTKVLQLPTEVEGRTLSWEIPETILPAQILLLGTIVAALFPELEREKLRERKKKRDEQLMREYPEMVNKMTLLLGAGMTVQGAWNQITDMYLAARAEGKISRNEVYEEMLITRHEIESGRGELRSYEAFGERCGLPRFRKFANYLVQNMKKGSLGICEILEKEVQEVFGEKRSKARKYGEEATTKLLLPMLLMLGIVIFIIMVPAIISFQVGT